MFRELLEYEAEHLRQNPAPRQAPSDWFQTATGRAAWVTEPGITQISIEDIARSLSRQCRFAGHLGDHVEHYSVAQHCVHVSHLVPQRMALIGLLHDAAEAYTQDIIRPLKRELGPGYKSIETAWALEIGEFFGLGSALANLPPEVKDADLVALMTEKRDLLAIPSHAWRMFAKPAPEKIVPLRAHLAYRLFMNRFEDCTRQH